MEMLDYLYLENF